MTHETISHEASPPLITAEGYRELVRNTPRREQSVTADAIPGEYLEDPAALTEKLRSHGMFEFPTHASGLTAAAPVVPAEAGEPEADYGMDKYGWLRDNTHIALALLKSDSPSDQEKAVGIGRGILDAVKGCKNILDEVITDPSSPKRLPVRFDRETLVPEPDSEHPRIQHDSTGYALLLMSKLMREDKLESSSENLEIVAKTAQYLGAVEYWHDADHSAWEEDLQIHLGSIGVATAGLHEAQQLFAERNLAQPVDIGELIESGKQAMHDMWYGDPRATDRPPRGEAYVDARVKLPMDKDLNLSKETTDALNESVVRPRKHDAALLFFASPLNLAERGLISEQMEREIVEDIENNLVRNMGVIRYNGDSYHAPRATAITEAAKAGTQREAEQILAEDRNQISAGIAMSDTEAQWTMFDPILAEWHGKQRRRARDAGRDEAEVQAHRDKQLLYVSRSLNHVIELPSGRYVVAEMDYYEQVRPDGSIVTAVNRYGDVARHDEKEEHTMRLIPNKHLPFNWGEAMLLSALTELAKD